MTAGRIFLLIDDDRFFAKLTATMLAPCEVVIAKNGAEGLAFMKARRFDLLITDLLMPEKDGIETILEIRRADARLPILAISGGGPVRRPQRPSGHGPKARRQRRAREAVLEGGASGRCGSVPGAGRLKGHRYRSTLRPVFGGATR